MKNLDKNVRKTGTGIVNQIRNFWSDESGMGTIEVILIIVVLIGLVIVFKKQINGIVEDVFSTIREETREITN
nr:Flp1 family type IVb pilin [uncultured Butyrivibrio sp.]